MTPKAFENGITTVMALGGSTNAVLHLLAMSRAAGCPLDLADFQRISDKTPFIADLKPSGKYLMEDLHKVCSSGSCASCSAAQNVPHPKGENACLLDELNERH